MAQNTKPTITEFETPDGNVADPPATVVTNGYIDGDIVNPCWATEFNKFRREHARLGNYILADTRTIYAGCTSGNDTTGTGTFAKPYKTIGKAYEMVAPFAYTEISLMETGDYTISADIEQRNKFISIVEGYGASATLEFVVFDDGTYNDIYRFNLYGSSYLAISLDEINVGEPVDIAKSWILCACGVKVYGNSYINFVGTSGIAFSATGASGGNKPSLVCVGIDDNGFSGKPSFTITAPITTNSKGYVLNALDLNAELNQVLGSIDNADYWLDNGKTKRHTIRAESDTVLTTALTPVTPNATITLKMVRGDNISGAVDMQGSEDTATLTYTDDETTSMLPAIKALFSSAYPDINTDDISITPVIVSGVGFSGFTITITDDSKNINFDVISVDSVFGGYLKESTGRDAIYYDSLNYNVQTNIADLK